MVAPGLDRSLLVPEPISLGIAKAGLGKAMSSLDQRIIINMRQLVSTPYYSREASLLAIRTIISTPYGNMNGVTLYRVE